MEHVDGSHPVTWPASRPLTSPALPLVSQNGFVCLDIFVLFEPYFDVSVGVHRKFKCELWIHFEGAVASYFLIHHRTTSPLSDRTRDKTSDSWFVDVFKIHKRFKAEKILIFRFALTKKISQAGFLSLFLMKGPCKCVLKPFIIHMNRWRFIGLLVFSGTDVIFCLRAAALVSSSNPCDR